MSLGFFMSECETLSYMERIANVILFLEIFLVQNIMYIYLNRVSFWIPLNIREQTFDSYFCSMLVPFAQTPQSHFHNRFVQLLYWQYCFCMCHRINTKPGAFQFTRFFFFGYIFSPLTVYLLTFDECAVFLFKFIVKILTIHFGISFAIVFEFNIYFEVWV